jgi:hypothetical protein
MKKRIFTIVAVMLLLISMLIASGCSGKINMLTGRWKMATYGDENGENQQQYFLPVTVDIYPDGRVDLLDQSFGKWTMDRDTFTFVSDDGTMKETGSFKIDYTATDSTGAATPTLTIFMDDQPVSYIFTKQTDLAGLLAYKKASASAAAASAAAAAAAATPAATANAPAASATTAPTASGGN